MIEHRHRNEFPTLASGIHLLSHSLGPVPRAARESMLEYIDAWEHHTSEDAWATSWWELSRRVGDRIARILGGAPGSVQIQPNASIALATVASCFDFKAGRNKVVTTALDFPSMEYFWDAQRQIGARVEVVPSATASPFRWNESSNAIDNETCLVALAHTSYRSSYRVDARAIVEHAHAKGALVLLDVYQSAGVMQLNATDWNVDFLIGGTIKWLCGGPSCGYLVRASRFAKRSATATDRLGRARFAIRFRARADALREIGATLRAGHAEYSRALLRDSGTRDHRSSRCC